MPGNITSEPELVLLGRRHYVKGALLLQFALSRLARLHGLTDYHGLVVRRCKQVEEVSSPLEMVPSDQAVDRSRLRVEISARLRDRNMDYGLLALPGQLRRLPDPVFGQEPFRLEGEDQAWATLPCCRDFWQFLNECVQLAKVFHLQNYNDQAAYRFVVGGFENLAYFQPPPDRPLTLRCKIMRHHLVSDTVYNLLTMSGAWESGQTDFRLHFVGRSDGRH